MFSGRIFTVTKYYGGKKLKYKNRIKTSDT